MLVICSCKLNFAPNLIIAALCVRLPHPQILLLFADLLIENSRIFSLHKLIIFDLFYIYKWMRKMAIQVYLVDQMGGCARIWNILSKLTLFNLTKDTFIVHTGSKA